MPSEREPWGIVLNEAMAAGCVPVVSDAVGAAPDLIVQGETGFAFPSRDWTAMREIVVSLASDAAHRERIARRAMAHADRYSHDAAAEGVVDALRALGHVASRGEPASVLATATRAG
jgi:glycosyltransferase involved in cell wall biosynthesis